LVGEDGSKYDDRRFFTVETSQNIPVAIVRNRPHEIVYLDDVYYLERALSPDRSERRAIQTTTFNAEELRSERLEKYKVIFCVNLPALNGDAAERLRAYIAAGGNVVWIAGDNVVSEAYNAMNEQAGRQLLPVPLVDIRTPRPQDNRDSWHIGFLDQKQPAFSPLVDPASLYESVLVYKHVRMAADEKNPKVQVLARLDDGEPLLTLRDIEQGKSLFFGATVHVNWSNLPLRPIFLPLIVRLTFQLAEVEQKWHNAIAGQPLVLQFPKETQPLGIEVISPGGETFRLKTEGVTGKIGQTFRYAETHEIGIYLLRMLQGSHPTEIAYSVNFDPDEADPKKMERKELEERFGHTTLVFAENPDDLSSTFALLREGKSLWSLFLTIVLICLVFETFLSNRLSPRQEDSSTQQPPPGMRRLAHKSHDAASA